MTYQIIEQILFEDSVASDREPEEIRINPESSSGTTAF